MKNYLVISLALIVITLTLANCKSTSQYTKTKLAGNWVLQRVNDQRIATDTRCILSLINGKKEAVYCQMNNDSVWLECPFQWIFEGDVITLEGTNPKGVYVKEENTLKIVNDTMLIYSGIVSPANPKVTQNYQYCRVDLSKSKYIGTWQVIDGTIDSLNKVRYIFSETGTYEYYSLKGENWVKDSENGGTWFLYGDFMVMNTPDKSGIRAQMWDTSIATAGSDKVCLQTNSDSNGTLLQSRTLKYIK